jgi:hypothetical protein
MRTRVFGMLVSGVGALALSLGSAGIASAATGTVFYSHEQAGYAATGAHFQYVQSTVKLPDASQFASEVASYGVSVQLWTKYRVAVVKVSNSTVTAGSHYGASVAVYSRTTHSLICSTASSTLPCPSVGSRWTDGSVDFAPGDDVTLAALYDRSTGIDHFYVDDETTGVELFYGGYVPGTGKVYGQARVGTEFSTTSPWGAFGYSSPPAETHLVTFRDTVLLTYSGQWSTLTSWWTHHKIKATADGTSATPVEVAPHDLFNSGANFGVYLEPLPL